MSCVTHTAPNQPQDNPLSPNASLRSENDPAACNAVRSVAYLPKLPCITLINGLMETNDAVPLEVYPIDCGVAAAAHQIEVY